MFKVAKWNDKVLKQISRPPLHNSNHTVNRIIDRCDNRRKAPDWVALEPILVVRSGIKLNKRNKLRNNMLSRYAFKLKRTHFLVKLEKNRWGNRQLERKLLNSLKIMSLSQSNNKLYHLRVWTKKWPLKQIMKIWTSSSKKVKRMIITRAWVTLEPAS